MRECIMCYIQQQQQQQQWKHVEQQQQQEWKHVEQQQQVMVAVSLNNFKKLSSVLIF